MDFSEEIKSLRQECYLSQQAFADKLGVAFSTVNRWENAKSLPNYQAMKRLIAYCKSLNIDSEKIESVWKENKGV